jgi:hypothetical protein
VSSVTFRRTNAAGRRVGVSRFQRVRYERERWPKIAFFDVKDYQSVA